MPLVGRYATSMEMTGVSITLCKLDAELESCCTRLLNARSGGCDMALTTPVLADGLRRIAAHMDTVADELNALDGQLGDGDLGVTMTRGGRALQDILPTLPRDVGMALMACAQAITKVSGSSYGTLLATGLLAAAKATRGPHRGAVVGDCGAAARRRWTR